LNSLNDFSFYLKRLFHKNIPDALATLETLSPFLLGALVSIFIMLLAGRVKKKQRSIIGLSLLLSGIFVLAYSAIHIIGGHRYLWSVLILSIISVSILLGTLRIS